jgi:hypothetical protein
MSGSASTRGAIRAMTKQRITTFAVATWAFNRIWIRLISAAAAQDDRK